MAVGGGIDGGGISSLWSSINIFASAYIWHEALNSIKMQEAIYSEWLHMFIGYWYGVMEGWDNTDNLGLVTRREVKVVSPY